MTKISDITINIFWLFGIYITGIAIALFISEEIAVLPFDNPWGVIGPLAKREYNPANEIIKFITIITLPSIILFIAFIFLKKQIKFGKTKSLTKTYSEDLSFESKRERKNVLFFLSLIFVFIMSLNIPTYLASTEHVDSFHEGESLGPAISYMADKVPYKETLFVHGIFQDPLRSVVAFKLFGKSIGAVRTLQSIIKIISFILLFILLLKFFQQNYLYAHIAFMILIFASWSGYLHFPQLLQILPRDTTTFLFLILFLSLNKFITSDAIVSATKFTLILFLFSFVPLASFAYSAERGLYLFTTFLLLSPIMFFFFMKKGFAKYYILSTVLGLVSATLLLGILLKGDFYSFFKFVFLELPRYFELMNGKIYQFYKIKFLFPIAIIALNLYLIFYHLLNELFNKNKISSNLLEYLKTHLIEICFLVVSIFLFRSALGRSDWIHVIYSCTINYILLIYFFIKYCMHPFLQKNGFLRNIVIILTIVAVSLLTTAGSYRIYARGVIGNNFPYTIDDSDFIPDNYKNTITLIKNSLGENDNFFTMTSEAIWYYYINKPSPSRFSVVWFAMPFFYQEQVVRDLKNNNVQLILYKNTNWANTIDGFTSQERLPIIDNYIRNNYSFLIIVDDNELWIKNSK